MKNRLSDLNDHLFAQIERLSDEELTPDAIAQEAARGAAMVAIADRIISNGDLQLRAAQLLARDGDKIRPHLPMIGREKGAP